MTKNDVKDFVKEHYPKQWEELKKHGVKYLMELYQDFYIKVESIKMEKKLLDDGIDPREVGKKVFDEFGIKGLANIVRNQGLARGLKTDDEIIKWFEDGKNK